jgi:large subunit ribosomal protein L11
MQFCKEYNAKTEKQAGLIVPSLLRCIRTTRLASSPKTPPTAVLIKKTLNIESASSRPNVDKVATLTKAQVEEIAKTKMPDLNAANLDSAKRMVEGTARSMGILIEK